MQGELGFALPHRPCNMCSITNSCRWAISGLLGSGSSAYTVLTIFCDVPYCCNPLWWIRNDNRRWVFDSFNRMCQLFPKHTRFDILHYLLLQQSEIISGLREASSYIISGQLVFGVNAINNVGISNIHTIAIASFKCFIVYRGLSEK